MEISELRSQIDQIDEELVTLFCKRMAVSAQISDYKKERNLPIYVPAREREILAEVGKMAGSDMSNYTKVLYSLIFELSRSYQSKRNNTSSVLHDTIRKAIDTTPDLFPQDVMVACQGVEGA